MILKKYIQQQSAEIELRFFPPESSATSPVTEKHKLLFVDSGALGIESPSDTIVLRENHFTCLPGRYECIFRVEPAASVTIVYFDDEFFQEHVTLQWLAPREAEPAGHCRLPVCRVQPHLHAFLQAFRSAEPDIRADATYQRLKANELFFLLGHCYPAADLGRLFRPFFSPEHDFRQQVTLYYRQVSTVTELGKTLGYSQSTLNRLFHRTFGMSAYRWMQRQKAGEIKKCLADRSISLKNIRNRFGFTSPSHLTKFCKNYFGATPRELRKMAAGHGNT